MSRPKGSKLTEEHKQKVRDFYVKHPKIVSEETKKRMSISQTGKKMSAEARRKISFARMGKKHSSETIEKMIKNHKGTLGIHWKMKEVGKKKISESKREEKNYRWKGEKVGYSALHRWIRKHLGRPTKCEFCGKDGLTGKKIKWANKNHKYKRNLIDWIRLCKNCHEKYDKNQEFVKGKR